MTTPTQREIIKSILSDTAVDDSFFAAGSDTEGILMKLLKCKKRHSLISHLEGLAQINKCLYPGMRLNWNREVLDRLDYDLNHTSRIWKQMKGKTLDMPTATEAIVNFYEALVKAFNKAFPDPEPRNPEPTHTVRDTLLGEVL